MKRILNTNQLVVCSCIIFLTVFLVNCAGPYKVKQRLIEEKVLDFYEFGNGTYWVYQDSLGNIDSNWVSDHTNTVEKLAISRGAIEAENIKYIINSTITTDILVANIKPDYNNNFTSCIYTEMNSVGTGRYDWILNFSNDNFFSNDKIVEHYDTYSLDGVIYTDVYLLKSSNSTSAEVVVIAKNIGIIRKKIDNELHDYKLIRYHIVK